MPSISVCIPTRNRADTLRQTLSAMQAQTRRYDEMIVGDDASDDNTPEVVRSFQDKRIRYMRHERNVGIYANWNSMVSQCSGDYICIYHDHDHYLPTILEESATLLDQNPAMSFAHTAIVFGDPTGTIVDLDLRSFPPVMPGEQLRSILANGWSSPVMAATAMVRRSASQEVGPYEYDRFGLGCDKHMWFRLAGIGTIGYVRQPQAVIQIRQRGVGTAKPSWVTEMGVLSMRAIEIEEAFASDTQGRSRARALMAREKDERLLILSFRALLLDYDWRQHERNITGQMSPLARVAYYVARPLRPALRHLILPLHYRRIERARLAAQRRADTYSRQNPHLFPPSRSLSAS
jgi:hypothetical protein